MKEKIINAVCGLVIAVCFMTVLGFTGTYENGDITTVQYIARTLPVALIALFTSKRFYE